MKGLLMTIETDRGAGRHIKQLMDRGVRAPNRRLGGGWCRILTTPVDVFVLIFKTVQPHPRAPSCLVLLKGTIRSN